MRPADIGIRAVLVYIRLSQGSFSGVGFAIPIDTVKGLVDQILVHGRVRRPSLGITIAPTQVWHTVQPWGHNLRVNCHTSICAELTLSFQVA